ncbi:MAG: hypothetical protein R6W72_11185 [Desulfurivibrionaceae bacterium]
MLIIPTKYQGIADSANVPLANIPPGGGGNLSYNVVDSFNLLG